MADEAAKLYVGIDTSGMEKASTEAPKVETALYKVADAVDKIDASSKKAAAGVGAATDAITKAGKAAEGHGKASGDAAKKLDEHADATKKTGDAAATTTRNLDDLAKKLGEQAAASGRAADAEFKAKQALHEKNAALKEQRELLLSVEESANKAVAAVSKMGGAPGGPGGPSGRWSHNPMEVGVRAMGLGHNTMLRDLFYGARAAGTGQQDDYWNGIDRNRDRLERERRERSEHGLRGVFGRAREGLVEGVTEGSGLKNLVAGGIAGGVGFLAAGAVEKGVEKVHELYEEIKKAGEEAEALERRWEGFGKGADAIERMRDAARGAGADFHDMAREIGDMEEKFNRFASSTDKNIHIIETLRSIASGAGMSQKDAAGFDAQVTSLFDKQRVTSADIGDLNGMAPGFAERLARQLGVQGGENGLKLRAANGGLSGEDVGNAVNAMYPEEMRRRGNRPRTLEEAENAAKAAAERSNEAAGKAIKLHDILIAVYGGVEWINDRLAKSTEEMNKVGTPKAGEKDAPGVVRQELPPSARQQREDAIAGRMVNYDQLYGKYGGVFAQRGDAMKDKGEIEDTIRFLEAQKNLNADQRTALDRLRQMLPEVKRQAEGTVTPFQRLTKETAAFADALEHGGGGATEMWKQAASMAEQQRRLVGAAAKDARDFLAVLQQQKRLEAEGEITANAARARQQNLMGSTILSGGLHGDDLRIQSEAETATWRFQKFGETVKDNDELVRRYADGLYKLKLALRDASDASEAKSAGREAEATRRAAEILMAGGSQAQADRARREVRDRYFAEDRDTAALGATAATTYQVSGGEAGGVSAGASQHWIAEGLRKRGIPAHIANGMWAGAMAESRGDIRAYNGDGGGQGAFGIGQWRGARQRELFRRYGRNPSDNQQLDYLAWEARGGDHGGRAVLAAGSEQEALSAYVHQFMRPGAVGAAGDMRRGNAYLRGLGGGAMPPAANDTITIPGSAARAAGPSAENRAAIDARTETNMANDLMAIAQEVSRARIELANGKAGLGALASGDPRAIQSDRLRGRIKTIEGTYEGGADRDTLIELTKEADQLDRQKALATEMGRIRSNQRGLESERELLRYGGDELKVQTEVLRERNKLLEMGVDLTSREAQAILKATEANARGNIRDDGFARRLKTMRQGMDELAQGFGDSLMGAFDQGMEHGDKVGKALMDRLAATAQRVLDRIMEATVVNPLVSAATNALQSGLSALMGGGGAGWSSSSTPLPGGATSYTALGGVYGSHGLMAFANGGTFNTPTRMAMANGGTAMIGEGGDTEAVLPLRRGPDGKLGVRSGGAANDSGGVSVVINDMRSAKGAEAVEVQERRTGNGQRQLHVMVRDSVRASTRSGEFDSDYGAQYGIARPVARR